MAKTSDPLTSAAAETDLSRYDNEWYKPGPRWKIAGWFIIGNLFINNYLPIPVGIKLWVLRQFGARLGQGVMVKPGVNIKYPWLLLVGNHVWIGEQVWIDNLALVTIGDHVCLSQGAMLLTGNHNYQRPTFDLITKPIVLENGAWVGAKALVCPGVTVHSHAVLAAGSVATGPLESYTIYQGNPAVAVRSRKLIP